MDRHIGKVGFWAGTAAAVSAVAYDVVQILQVLGALRFPADEILIYSTSLGIVIPFLLEMLALYHVAAPERRYWAHAALIFTVIYAVFTIANYVVQLATVIPAKLKGASGGLGILEQTPHSMFWDFDAVGYIAMGLACLLAIPAVDRAGFGRRVRASLIAHALVTPLICIVYFHPDFSTRLLFLGFPWAVTAPLFMGMLALYLRQQAPAAGRG